MLLEAVFRFRHATANKGIVGIQYHGIQYPIHHESICALFPKQEVTIVISQVNLHVPVMINRLRLPFLE